MQLAIIHYHLDRGGVTQAIGNHLLALSAVQSQADPLRVVVFFGGRRAGWWDHRVRSLAGLDVALVSIPELEYAPGREAAADTLASSVFAELKRMGMRPEDTLVHVHNHALGKNASLPGALRQLNRDGFALLLQIHDFAEDFRPANYRDLADGFGSNDPESLSQWMYPQGAAIHYAVLNGRDYHILETAGVASDRLHILPNPLREFAALPDRAGVRTTLSKIHGISRDQTYILYPVRGIRRKNLGELLLCAALCDENTSLALTLPPLNPVEQPRYRAWKRLASQLDLPLLFEVGRDEEMDFSDHMVAADRIVTTSVAEGFGMVFLESWLASRMLIGRDLPEITHDFVAAGLEFPHLSPTVNVPIDWVGADTFKDEMRRGYASVLDAYRRPRPDWEQLDGELSRLFANGLLDFARCSARLQEYVVSQVAGDTQRRAELRRLNPGTAASLSQRADADSEHIRANAETVRDKYSLASSGLRLRNLYQTVLDSPRREELALSRGSSILDAFLNPQRFNPIRID